MRILGLDPGIATVGFGIVDTEGSKQKLVTCGVITTPAHTPLVNRLDRIYSDLEELIGQGLLSEGECDDADLVDDSGAVDYGKMYHARFVLLREAYSHSCAKETEEFQAFVSKNAYWLEDYALYMAIKDAHGGTKDGVHSGCMAGAWMAVTRGIAGMRFTENGVSIAPHFIPWWESVSFCSVWHGQKFRVTVDNTSVKVTADENNTALLQMSVCEEDFRIAPGDCIEYGIGGEFRPVFG